MPVAKPVAKPAVNPIRRASRAGENTRKKLLDAAELLFAERGYDGASLRDIAQAADLHIALSTYHFKTKESMFEEVIKRRALTLQKVRLKALEALDRENLETSEMVRRLIYSYAMPMIRARYSRSRQWQAHVRIVASLINVKQWTPMVRRNYDNCARQYLERFQRALPNAERNALLNAFSFMIAMMLYVCSYTNRFGPWRDKTGSKSDDIANAVNDFMNFTHAGFMTA